MIGQATISAGLNVAAPIYLIGAVSRILGLPLETRVPFFGSLTSWGFQLFVMVLLMVPQVVVNVFGVKLTARLNDISVYWHIAEVAVIDFLCALFGSYLT